MYSLKCKYSNHKFDMEIVYYGIFFLFSRAPVVERGDTLAGQGACWMGISREQLPT
jgi:hypothetical protein